MPSAQCTRIAWSMTVDPDGAMHAWVDPPAGHTVLPVPTQELVPLLGVPAYQDLLVELCERERPTVLVTHPPYDYLTPTVADRLRAAGTRLVAYAFDDEIFAPAYTAATWEGLHRCYDRYVTTREVPWATAPLPSLPAQPAECDVALVGRCHPRRQRLVEALRGAGLRVQTRGNGWPEGFCSRRQLLALYARAAVVLTTADWEDCPVPMVKHRLLDTAMLGVFQIAQQAPDLPRYFPAEEVPRYGTPEELVQQVRQALADPQGRRARAAAARDRALREHTWSRRLPSLLGPLFSAATTPAPPGAGPSALFDQALLALATRAEADDRPGAAEALAGLLLARHPTQATALAVRGRCLRQLGEPEQALQWLRRAAHALAQDQPPAAAALAVRLPAFGVGTGQGRHGLWPPAAEAVVYLLATLLELGRVDEAERAWAEFTDPVLRRAVATALDPGDDPAVAPLRRALQHARAHEGG